MCNISPVFKHPDYYRTVTSEFTVSTLLHIYIFIVYMQHSDHRCSASNLNKLELTCKE